jgi:hypothetical protein
VKVIQPNTPTYQSLKMYTDNGNNRAPASLHNSEGVVGDKSNQLTSFEDKIQVKMTRRNTRMPKLFSTKAKVTPLPVRNCSTKERSSTATDSSPIVYANSPTQTEMRLEQVPVDEAPPLPMTFQEQEQQDQKLKIQMRDKGGGMKRIDINDEGLPARESSKESYEEGLEVSNDAIAESNPQFYAVEAKVVDESSLSSDGTVYEAVLVVPCWKRRNLILGIVAFFVLTAVIAIAVWAALRPLPLPPVPLNCSAIELGKWYDEDCNATCDHVIAINDDVTIAYRTNPNSGEELQLEFIDGTNQTLLSHAPLNYIVDISLSDNIIAAGIPWAGPNYTGIVSMFEKTSEGVWNRTIQLAPDNIDLTAHFGSSVSIDETSNLMAIGANDDGKTGSAFIYRKLDSTWTQVAKVTGEKLTENFGSLVIVKGNLFFISDPAWSDPNHDDNAAGAVFVYRFDPVSNNTQLETTLTNEDCDGKFGWSISLQEQEGVDLGLFVGCPGDDTSAGTVYYYKLLNANGKYSASLKQKIQASSPEALYRFGDNVVYGDGFLAVGTHRDEEKLHEKVHIFIEWDNLWREVLVIDSPGGAHWFGFRLAINDTKIMITSWDNVYSYQLTCIDV